MRTDIALIVAALAASPALAAEPCPGGQPAVVRVSKILPKGSMAGFREAARDHAAWYRGHGIAVTQFVAPVLVYDAKAKAQVVSTTEAMTVRIGDGDGTAIKRDAGWAAFVAKYQANSRVISETRVCFPKTLP